MRPVASVGIDVAEPRKGLDLVALGPDRELVEVRSHLTVDAVADLTMSLRPSVVCIDSPSGWSISGRSRLAERELSQIGIQSYRTGPDPGDHSFYRWMRVGFDVFRRLSATYPLFTGGSVAGTAAEVFPHATACLLAGRSRPPGVPKARFRRDVLQHAGVRLERLRTLDHVDAALAALTGVIALDGEHSSVGDPDEGVVLLPRAVNAGFAPLAGGSRSATLRV